jgi:hypothetical protein
MRAKPKIFRISLVSLLRRSSGYFWALMVLFSVGTVHSVHADEAWDFVQITCAPELGYFSIRRFFVMNLPSKGPYLTEGLDPGPAAVATLQRKNGIFDAKSLQDNPAECAIPAVSATQGWNDGRPSYSARVVGHLYKIDDLISPVAEVFFQGKSLGNIYTNGGGSIVSIETWYDGALEVRTCQKTPWTDAADGALNLTCRFEPFKGDAR